MTEPIQEGDYALHGPTGETWWILGVNKARDRICVAGWPPTEAKLSDCTLVKRREGISDEVRRSRNAKFGADWDGDV